MMHDYEAEERRIAEALRRRGRSSRARDLETTDVEGAARFERDRAEADRMGGRRVGDRFYEAEELPERGDEW